MAGQITGRAKGPTPASVLIIGEAFGDTETIKGVPFVGQSGQELNRMLESTGFVPENCRFTNLVNSQPPRNDISQWFYSSKKKASDVGVQELAGKYPKEIIRDGLKELQHEIESCAPELIIALGNSALWSVTGQWGITKWRGSLMRVDDPVGTYPITVVPTYHPAAILRQWSWRTIALHDLRYASEQIPSPIPEPEWEFILEPKNAWEVREFLDWLNIRANQQRIRIAADIETRGGQIACIGFAVDEKTAICIPILSVTNESGSYWSEDDEVRIVSLIRRTLTHPNIEVIWQNGLYDLQYIFACWGFISNAGHDTMLMQHAAFPGALPKGLDFLASMYCEYRYYWKDDGKEWDPKKTPESVLWRYNCLDACRTFEVAGVLLQTLDKLGLKEIYDHSMSLYEPVLFMMINGVGIDRQERVRQKEELIESMNEIQSWINFVLDEEFNVDSTPQMRSLFYDQIGLPIIRHRKTGNPTLDKDALPKIAKKHPLLSPLVDRILVLRSASTFNSNFLQAILDSDGRMRCQYHIGGTETGRFSSTKNAFGRGANLENIPRPRDQTDETPILEFPNVRSLFVPDPGMVIADFDLDRADAHCVAWAAGADALKEMFAKGTDVHLANAFVIGGEQLPPIEELHPDHPKYKEHLKPHKLKRQFAKNLVHGTNYGGKERAVHEAVSSVYGLEGITIHQVREAQDYWFATHPEIAQWHKDIEIELMTRRRITTPFGRTRFYLDRIDPSVVNQALAYLGQSPVADVINKGLRKVYENLPWCQNLLQNHDSIVFQFPKDNVEERCEDIRHQLQIPIPYDDPLVIPVGWKLSESSWGDV